MLYLNKKHINKSMLYSFENFLKQIMDFKILSLIAGGFNAHDVGIVFYVLSIILIILHFQFNDKLSNLIKK